MRSGAPRSRRGALALLCSAQFLFALDFSVVNVALPHIGSALGFSTRGIGWVVSAYALAFGGFLMVGGRAADLVGRRRLFMAGLAVVGVASAGGGLAGSPAAVVAARVLQGLGAAILVPAALALIAGLFDDGAERTRALGLLGGAGSFGTAFGVVLGGVLTDLLSWRWTFLANVPAVALALALTPAVLPHDRPARRAEPLDLRGAVLGTIALTLLLYALERVRDAGFASATGGGALAAALVLLGAFLAVERRAPAPVLPLALLRRRSIAGANAAALVTTGTFLPAMVLLSTYLQTTLGLSPLATGLAFLPLSAVTLACNSWAAPRLIAALGLRRVGCGALCALGFGLLELTRLSADSGYLADVLPGMVLIAVGASTMFPVVFSAGTAGVPLARQGAAAAAVSSSRQIGAAIGATAMVGAAASDGYAMAFGVAVAGVLAGAVVALRTLPAPSNGAHGGCPIN